MRTYVLLIFAIVFGIIFYSLEPQEVNSFFVNLFARSKNTAENAAHRVEGTVGLTSETIQLGGHSVTVQIADTDAERFQGLSGRSSLAADHGMLFVFPTANLYMFTMRGMRFPLDFVWVNGTRVVGVTENVPPPVGNESPREVDPPGPVNAVLEVNAGSLHTWGVGTGSDLIQSGA